MTDDTIVIKHLALSGGGLKGIAYIGVYKALTELGVLKLESIAGSSIGALAGLFVVLGFTPDELYSFVTSFNFNDIKEFDFINFLSNWGIEKGDKVIKFLQAFMRHKTGHSDLTFKQLYERYPIKLTMVTSLLNRHRPVYMNHELTPDEYVIWSIRKSISIPLFFTPIKDKDNNCYVDGGLLDNFPIAQCPDTEETLGIYFGETNEEYPIDSFEDFLMNNLFGIFNLNCRNSIQSVKKARLININTHSNSAYNLFLDYDTKKNLYDSGYQSVINHFQFTKGQIEEKIKEEKIKE